jgi:hypothetical protein
MSYDLEEENDQYWFNEDVREFLHSHIHTDSDSDTDTNTEIDRQTNKQC